MQKYKVFIYSKSILFTSEITDGISLKQVHENQMSRFKINSIFSQLLHSQHHQAAIIAQHPEKALADFLSCYPVVEASGGLVRNENGDRLFIFRRGYWDLPKGHIEAGETPEEAALREVSEETGLCKLQLLDLCHISYHMFQIEEQWHIKKTRWYHMNGFSSDALIPQFSEGITDIQWIAERNLLNIIPKTHASLQDWLWSETPDTF